MRKVAVLVLIASWPAWAVKFSITNLAAGTTIAVNGEAIVKTVRHPVKSTKTAAKKIKKAVRGK